MDLEGLEGLDVSPAGPTQHADPGGPPILVDDATGELMPPPAELPSRPNLPAVDEPSMRSQAQVPPLDPDMQAIYELAACGSQRPISTTTFAA